MGWVVNATTKPLYTPPLPGKVTVPIVKAGWASEQVWTGAQNLALTGIRFPDLPAGSESLNRLRYTGSISCEYDI
jgi:hypothetical protein